MRFTSPLQNQLIGTIRPFVRTAFSLPLKRRRYNDDIQLDPYRPALLHFAGGQRKGTHEPLGRCLDRKHHVWRALQEDFPLSLETPLPSETIRAIEFTRSTPDVQIMRIWDVQLRAAEDLVRSCAPAQTKWNACVPESISAASGKFQTVAAKQLIHQLNVGGAAWIDQFAHVISDRGQTVADFAVSAREEIRRSHSNSRNFWVFRCPFLGKIR